MCATCVAEGSAYLVPSLVGLRLMAARAARKRSVAERRLDEEARPAPATAGAAD